MTNLYITKDGVRGKTSHSEKVGIIRVSTISNVAIGNVKRMLTVDNFSGFDKTYQQREEPEIKVFDINNETDPIFTGTHQELVEKLTENHQSLLETLMVISFNMGSLAYYTGDSMADIQTAIQLAKEFEEKHRDTDWTEEDWLLAIDNYSRHRIQQLMTEE